MTASESKRIDSYIAKFYKNNPHCTTSIVEGELLVDKPWGSDDCRLTFDIGDELALKTLCNIKIDPRFDAIIHLKHNKIEFAFGFLSPDDELAKDYINRSFSFVFMNEEYKCSFNEPSRDFLMLATAFRRLPSDMTEPTVPQMYAFKDFQRLEKLPERHQEWFKSKNPRNFFISLPKSCTKINLPQLSTHLNFIMKYYDRHCPVIVIRSDNEKLDNLVRSRRYFEDGFPKTIALRQVDDIIIKLIEVARHSAPRFAFLYYYQVFEYAGYYYLDEKVKKTLKKFLRNPSVINCGDDNIEEIIEIFSDTAHNDDVKIRKVIEENCCPKAIWREIDNDKDFFADDLIFDGGVEIKSLISSDTTESAWVKMWTPKLFDQVTKIRNCLVHSREKREARGILPTNKNNQKIRRYLPIMARMAEQLAIQL